MNERPLRWGFLGAANICRKNWKAVHRSGTGVVAGVASRDAGRAREFIAECQAEGAFPQALSFGSYEALLASPEIDAVYVPLPTGLRKEWVIRAAEAGKHVLCEKPCAVSTADLREMIGACARAQVQFMDGVMFIHSERMPRLRAILDAGTTVGRPLRITTGFSFRGNADFFQSNIRMHRGLEPAGCLGDLGWYCIRYILWAAGWRRPREVHGRLLQSGARADSPGTVPTEFSGELIFDGGLSASFYCSFLAGFQQWARIDGELGVLAIDDFVLPKSDEIPQEALLFRDFARAVRSGRPDPFWPEIALLTQEVMEACSQAASPPQTAR